jgi:hypothetical protein
MDSRFNIGDNVTVKVVDTASSVGYLGSHRIVMMREFDRLRNEWRYLTQPYNGTGYAWFWEHEL